MGWNGKAAILTLILITVPIGAFSQEVFIAGVEPSERPASAPVLIGEAREASWLALALTGVDEPYPDSLNFLEDQGAWFNPFTKPGMTGPYDIRNWH